MSCLFFAVRVTFASCVGYRPTPAEPFFLIHFLSHNEVNSRWRRIIENDSDVLWARWPIVIGDERATTSIPAFILNKTKEIFFSVDCCVSYSGSLRVFSQCPKLSKLTVLSYNDEICKALFEVPPPFLEEVTFPDEFSFNAQQLHKFLSKDAVHLKSFFTAPEVHSNHNQPTIPSDPDLGATLTSFASDRVSRVSLSTDMMAALQGGEKSDTFSAELRDLLLYPSANYNRSGSLADIRAFAGLRSLTFYRWVDPISGPLPIGLASISFVHCVLPGAGFVSGDVPRDLRSLAFTDTVMADETMALFVLSSLRNLYLQDNNLGHNTLTAIAAKLPLLESFTWKSVGDQAMYPSLASSLSSLKSVTLRKYFDTAPFLISHALCKEISLMPSLENLDIAGFQRPPRFIVNSLLVAICRVTSINISDSDLGISGHDECLCGSKVRRITAPPNILWMLCALPKFFPNADCVCCKASRGMKYHRLFRFIRKSRPGISVFAV
jgi:hypothetical protein